MKEYSMDFIIKGKITVFAESKEKAEEKTKELITKHPIENVVGSKNLKKIEIEETDVLDEE